MIAADIEVPGTVILATFGEIIWYGIFCVAWASNPPVDLVSLKYNFGLLFALASVALLETENGNPVWEAFKPVVSILTV